MLTSQKTGQDITYIVSNKLQLLVRTITEAHGFDPHSYSIRTIDASQDYFLTRAEHTYIKTNIGDNRILINTIWYEQRYFFDHWIKTIVETEEITEREYNKLATVAKLQAAKI